MSKMKKMIIALIALFGFYLFVPIATKAEQIIPQADGSVVIASEILTAEQVIQQYMDDFGVTQFQAMKELGISPYERAVRTYRTLAQQYQVNWSYRPTIKFYCETSESGSFRGIVRILNVSLDRYYNGTSKAFGGSIYTNLENANSVYYVVNGDYYNNGITTGNVGLSVGIGQAATASFGVSNQSNHYAYKYVEGRIRF